jgi:pimeloyl-ACP methyl ester carboxylesterase
MTGSSTRVESTDGVSLAVFESGDSANPTVVAVHGYPDTHTLWDSVVEQLADDFHVVTYDVRGVGESDKPVGRGNYVIEQLLDDLALIIDAVAPAQKVHLLGHDWGSIQCWDAVSNPEFTDRVASFTSISGVSLDHAAVWLRTARQRPFAVAQQLLESYYTAFFQLPGLPEFAARSGVIDRVAKVVGRLGRGTNSGGPASERSEEDMINGLELYRANMPVRFSNPVPRKTDIPVQVIAPGGDLLVSPALQTQAPEPFVTDLRISEIAGGHWVVVDSPDLIAELTKEFITNL